MSMLRTLACAVAVVSLNAGPAQSQTIGYAEAVDRLGAACGKDIVKFCKQANLGGGRIQQCLNKYQTSLAPACTSSLSEMQALLQKRAAARTAVLRVCDADIRRMCTGIQQGDGNLMECFYKAKSNISPQCRQTVADVGYEVGVAPASSRAGIQLSSVQLVDSLQSVAGPGAGKTYLFRKLLDAAEGQRHQRLVLTFINTLKQDLANSLGDASDVFTLHGDCQHLLHRHEALRGALTQGFRCYPGLVSLIRKDWEWLQGQTRRISLR